MPKSALWKLTAPCLLIIAAAWATFSFAVGDIADVVLGQANFTYNLADFPSARKLNSPQGVAIDASGNLYVADVENSRVLGWNSAMAFANGSPANLVIGQPDFYSTSCNSSGISASSLCNPVGVAVDGSGNLYVADTDNNRVLEYNTPFGGSFPSAGGSANLVFGQADSFASNTANNGGVSANSLNSPRGVAVDAYGHLYVADTLNNRVLEYADADATAHLVFGQGGSFTSHTENSGGVSANSLNYPNAVALDPSGDLYVADTANSRVLEYDTPLINGTTASLVFGQGGSFTSYTTNYNGVSASSLDFPFGVAVDSSGNVYIADENNNRVLEYNTPLTNGTTASLVFGQGGSFGSTGCNDDTTNGSSTASDLCSPYGVALDATGNLYVADAGNNRVLEYNPPFTSGTTATLVLGQPGFQYSLANFPDQYSLYLPSAVVIDTSATPNHLYVADEINSRVLGWNDVTTFTNGSPADLVIGQPDFYSIASNDGTDPSDLNGVGADSLSYPFGVAVDSSGNLYVADDGNSRVLEYNTPFGGSFPSAGGSANRVFGQGGSPTSTGCNSDTSGGNPTADDLCYPYGVAVDAGGHLYISDYINSRVLEYNTPLTSSTANLVFGQGGSPTSAGCNSDTSDGNPTASDLCKPYGVAVDAGGDLYIADYSNNRVLEYNAPLTNGAAANMVLGQSDFFSGDCNAVSGSSLCSPSGIVADSSSNLWVSDSGNNRVLEYNAGFTTGATANRVFGQDGSFTSSECNFGAASVSAGSLCIPNGVALDSAGNLYVADTNNNRVLDYKRPLSPSSPTATPTAAPTTSMSVTASLSFGNVTIGAAVTKTLTVHNTGTTTPLVISAATSSDSEYALSGTGTCGSIPVTVAPKLSCTLAVAFMPNGIGAHSATLTLRDDATGSPQSVTLSGSGVTTMTVSPTSYAFGTEKDGSLKTKLITVHNDQSISVSLSEGMSGANAGDFQVTGGTCTSTLNAKTSCTLIVTYAPTVTGTESATLTVTDSPDPLGPYTVSFTAAETIPDSISTKKLNFGNVVQTASKTLTITVTNLATEAPITLATPAFGGTNPGDFSISRSSATTCTGSLAAGSSCTYGVTFTPSSEAAESGTLSIGVAQDPNGGPPAVNLSGTGLIPIKVSPTSLSYGTVKQGKKPAKTVTVTNNGGAAVSLTEGITTNTGNPDFSVTGGSCGESLAGGGTSCTYTVTYAPSTTGSESATLGVSAGGDAASPHNVNLSGTGGS